MKTWVFRIILLILFAHISTSFSQNTVQEDSSFSYFSKGLKAIQFSINENFSLRTFQGNFISAKYHLNDNKAIRLGISLNARHTDGKSESEDMFDESKTQNYYLNLRGHYLDYIVTSKRVNIFWGIGPYLTYRYDHRDDKQEITASDTLYSTSFNERNSDDYHMGVSLSAGAEIFITHYLSLHAEYSSIIYYRYNTAEIFRETIFTDPNTEDNITRKKLRSHGYYISSDQLLFGLSVYF